MALREEVQEAVDRAVGAPEYLTLPETAKLVRAPEATLYGWRHRNYGPPARRVGRRLLYRRDEVIAWVEGQTDPAA